MASKGYQLFCPLAFASGIIEPRWTMLILLEMYCGSTRFSDIQRGVPGMSPSLLSLRLKEMVTSGLLVRDVSASGAQIAYGLTPMARELEPLVYQIAAWAHKHIDPSVSLECLDHHLLMWNIRRKIEPTAMPNRKVVIEFILRQPGHATVHYWLIVKPGAETDLCLIDPKDVVDLYVSADLRALTSAWMGYSTFRQEIAAEKIALIGNQALAASLSRWLICSPYARQEPAVLSRSA